MNYRSPTFFRSLARAGLALCILSVAAVQAETRVIKDAGFAVPESVEYYQGEDVYFVSNVKGHPLEPAANGFISKLSPEGKVLDLQWLASDPARYTFHAPKGLAIAGSHLYVADLEEVHVFELPQGKHLRSIPIDGASVLNGISPASEDSVIVVDTGYVKSDEGIAPSQTDALYRVWSDGRYELIASDVAMGNPNGVFFAGKDEILVVTFGSSELFQLNLKGSVSICLNHPWAHWMGWKSFPMAGLLFPAGKATPFMH